MRGRGRDRIVPLYARCAARQPNLALELATTPVRLWGEDVPRDDPWHYTVAMLAAPGNEGLVPLSAQRELAREAVSIGRQIVEAQCGSIRAGATQWARCEVRYDERAGTLELGPGHVLGQLPAFVRHARIGEAPSSERWMRARRRRAPPARGGRRTGGVADRLANRALGAARRADARAATGHPRTHKARGVAQTPGQHLGPAAS